MLSLFFIGNITETIIGKKRFLTIYLLSGLAGGILYILLGAIGPSTGLTDVLGDPSIPGVGASGALFGLIGILAIIIPKKKVFLLAGPIFLFILQFLLSSFISGPALSILEIIISILIFLSILSIFLPLSFLRTLALQIEMPLSLAPVIAIVPLVLLSFFFPLPIGNSAHLGGLLAGLIYGSYLKSKYPQKISLIRKVIK